MARQIDADALKDNMFHYAAPEMVWDRGDIEHKINEMPTISAIPVEWMEDKELDYRTIGDKMFSDAFAVVIGEWQKEQEANT